MLFLSKKTKLKSATTYWTQGTPAVLFFTSFLYKRKLSFLLESITKKNITSDESRASSYDVKISSSLRREAMGLYLPFIYIVTN